MQIKKSIIWPLKAPPNDCPELSVGSSAKNLPQRLFEGDDFEFNGLSPTTRYFELKLENINKIKINAVIAYDIKYKFNCRLSVQNCMSNYSQVETAHF